MSEEANRHHSHTHTHHRSRSRSRSHLPQQLNSLIIISIIIIIIIILCAQIVMSEDRISDPREIVDEISSQWRRVMSPEIVEVEDKPESRSGDAVDVFIAVGKHDLDVVKWAVDHVVAPGARVYLVHVFPPVTHIHTPVGKLSRSQLSKEQVQIYINEENNKRRSLLQKYIRICTDAKIAVETMLLDSNTTTKAILDLIHVVNITNLVIGTKQTPSIRRLRKGPSKGEFIKKNAPDFCQVSVICNGKQVTICQRLQLTGITPDTTTTSQNGLKVAHSQVERKFFECACFSRKVD